MGADAEAGCDRMPDSRELEDSPVSSCRPVLASTNRSRSSSCGLNGTYSSKNKAPFRSKTAGPFWAWDAFLKLNFQAMPQRHRLNLASVARSPVPAESVVKRFAVQYVSRPQTKYYEAWRRTTKPRKVSLHEEICHKHRNREMMSSPFTRPKRSES